MFARTIKKALLFFVVDILVIIGIFVLQFSNDSIITEKNGNLQITLSETKDNNNNTVLRNKFNLIYNGVTLSCDDTKPALIRRKGHEADDLEAVALINWQKMADTDYLFNFTNDINLHVNITDTSEKGTISILAELPGGPDGVEEFYMPYALAANNEITSESSSRIVMGSKKAMWELTAYSLDNQMVRFTKGKPLVSYAYFEQTVEFKFASLAGSQLVDSYDGVVRTFRDSVISAYKANTNDALSNEEAVVAYVSEQASRGNYKAAVDEVPQTFKRGTNRTFLSAPFFNNLVEMNKTLDTEIAEKNAIIRKAINGYSLSLFTIRNIADYMYLYSNSGTIKNLTERAGDAEIGNASLAEAAGILRTYVEMMPLSKAYASHMEGSLKDCVLKIEKACKMEGNNLTLQENGTFLSVVQAVEVGDALLRYGLYVGDQSFIAGGKAIIASYMAECGSFDIRTLSDLYPVIVHDNTFYPHFVKIYTAGNDVVWAWTSAMSVDYERGEGRSVSFNFEFPLEHTHYVILRGIEPFRSIYIYDMAFRTDQRFESYNSSGYVYDSESKALLLKSRHKSETEAVRLQFGSVQTAAPKPEETEASDAGNASNTAATETAPVTETPVPAPAETVTTETTPAVETPAPAPTQKTMAEIQALQAQAAAAAAAAAAQQ